MCLAIPGKILNIYGEEPLTRSGKVSFGGTIIEVNLACVPEAKVDDYVLVHVGVAISVIDPREAEQVFQTLKELDEMSRTEDNET